MTTTLSVDYDIDDDKSLGGNLIARVHRFGFEVYAPTQEAIEKRIRRAVLLHLSGFGHGGLGARINYLAAREIPFEITYEPDIATNGASRGHPAPEFTIEVKAPALA